MLKQQKMHFKKIINKPLALLLIVFTTFISLQLNAQLVYTTPAIPTQNQEVTVFFNAALGSGGLANYTGDVYAHTGVITNQSVAANDWKYVKSEWGENTPETKMEALGGNLYSITISPNPKAFYAVPDGEDILQLAFVFRSAQQVNGQWLEGKTDGGGDIFVNLFEDGLNINITLPDTNPPIYELGDEVQIAAQASNAQNMQLSINGSVVQTANQINFSLTANQLGRHDFVVSASNNGDNITESGYFFVRGPVSLAPLPYPNLQEGINTIDNSTVVLVLYAPYKDYAFALGDFSNWEVSDNTYMNRTPNFQQFWVELNGLEAESIYRYQYLVDDLRIADPFCEQILDMWNDPFISQSVYPNLPPFPAGSAWGIVSTFQINQPNYNWQTTNYQAPDKDKLVIYELLIRDFTEQHTFEAVIEKLDYLENLGINAIELMPIAEFEANSSWGYNTSFALALDKYYGTKNHFKQLVDECHQRGIAVILDIVLNHHFGQSPMVQMYFNNNAPTAQSPWFNTIATHDFNVGYDFNHQTDATKNYVQKVVSHWLQEYKIDGFRFDLSKGFTQNNTLGNTAAWGNYDASRIQLWKNIADFIWANSPETYIILEHFADNDEETELANYGMLLWGNHNYNYSQAAKGTSGSNFSWISYQNRGWDAPHTIGYMESHDEERMMYRCLQEGNTGLDYDITDLDIALQRCALSANFFFPVPGPKLIWQFGELGYDYSINYNGRLGEKPVRWDYFNEPNRKHLHDVYAALIHLKNTETVFQTENFELDVASSIIKRIHLYGDEETVTILGNFDVYPKQIVPEFNQTGWWYEFYTGDSIFVDDLSLPITFSEGEYRLYSTKKFENSGNLATNTPLITNQIGLNILQHKGQLHIQSNQAVNISIFNLNGQLLKEVEQQSSLRINTQSWSKQVVLVKIEQNGNSQTQKVAIF